MPQDCTNNHLTPEEMLMSMLTTDTNGNCALRLIPVADGDADYKDCDLANISALDLFRLIVDVDGNGNLGLRVIEGTDAGTDCVGCNNNNISFKDQVLNHVIGLGSDGNPALRLATP